MGNTAARDRNQSRSSASKSSVSGIEENPLAPASTSVGKLENGWWCPTVENRLASIDGIQLVATLKELDVLHSWPSALFPIVAGYAMRPYLVLLVRIRTPSSLHYL
jgi:hypothetical protein